jgi:hypothetical protein
MNGGKLRLESKLLIDFLNTFINKKNPIVNFYIKSYKDYVIKNQKRKEDTKVIKKMSSFDLGVDEHHQFSYGCDEMFMDYFMYPKILADAKLKIYYHIRHPQGNLYWLIKNTFTDNMNLVNSLIKKFSQQYKLPYNTLDEFTEVFVTHDFAGEKHELHTIYNNFYKFIVKNYKEFAKTADSNKLRCFMTNDVYLHDKNSIILMKTDEKKKILKTIKDEIAKMPK